jgi:hypothetical protein
VVIQLHTWGYTLQSNKKCIREGGDNPDRNAPFEYSNGRTKQALKSLLFSFYMADGKSPAQLSLGGG